jgi:hypothetical protein
VTLALAMVVPVVLASCGGGESSKSPTVEACGRDDVATVLGRYLSAARRERAGGRIDRGSESKVRRMPGATRGADLTVREGLIARAERLPRSARSGPGAVPVAAALYAVSLPRAEREGAYAGCLSELREDVAR